MPSLYAQYILEREGKHILETERGFATYSILGAEVYVQDIYIKPEHRKSGEAAAMTDCIAIIAKEKGCKVMTGTVCPSTNGSTDSLKALLAYGFRLMKASQDFIVLIKEI